MVFEIISLAVSGTNVFDGTWEHDILHSTDNGDHWSVVSAGLPDVAVPFLVASPTDLYAGTWENGVWRRPLSEMMTSVENTRTNVPMRFTLCQNYPNPFNPSTTITYELPKSTEVKLSVYDILGREVSVLVNERRNAGVHEVKLDAAGLASGVYFYRLQAGSFVDTKKFLLVH